MRFSIFVAIFASVAGTLAAPLLETRDTAVAVSNVVCDNSSGCVYCSCLNITVSNPHLVLSYSTMST